MQATMGSSAAQLAAQRLPVRSNHHHHLLKGKGGRPAPSARAVKVACERGHGAPAGRQHRQATNNIIPAKALTRRAGLGLGAASYGLQLLPGTGSWSTLEAAAESEQGPEQVLHIVLRVPDLQAAADYYQAVGMSVVRQRPGNIFVGYGPEAPVGDRMVIELAQGKEGLEKGNALDHLLISVDDPGKARKAALAAGGKEVKVNAGRTNAVEGPDGVSLVFIDGGQGIADPLCRIKFNVDSLEPTRLFMQGLGMKVFESRSDSVTGRKGLIMGYGRGPRSAVSIEITSAGRGKAEPVIVGGVYDRMAISSTDINASVTRVQRSIEIAKNAKVASGRVVKKPFVIERLGTTIAEVQDPTGLTYAFVDTNDFLRELA